MDNKIWKCSNSMHAVLARIFHTLDEVCIPSQFPATLQMALKSFRENFKNKVVSLYKLPIAMRESYDKDGMSNQLDEQKSVLATHPPRLCLTSD